MQVLPTKGSWRESVATQLLGHSGEAMREDYLVNQEPYQGGSVMGWAGINTHGRTDLILVPGRLNAERYVEEILEPHVIPMRAAIGDDFLLMEDNATPHTARITTTFLDDQGVDTIDWPARSPDLNPIENLWDQFKCVMTDMSGITQL